MATPLATSSSCAHAGSDSCSSNLLGEKIGEPAWSSRGFYGWLYPVNRSNCQLLPLFFFARSKFSCYIPALRPVGIGDVQQGSERRGIVISPRSAGCIIFCRTVA